MNPLVTEARAPCEGATKGPWVLTKDGRYEDHDECRIELPDDNIELCKYENGELIARSRTLIPEMAAEIERLESKVQFLTEAYDRQATIHEALTKDFLAVKRERDAMESNLRGHNCETCKHSGASVYDEPCRGCDGANNWEWRGPQEGAAE